MKKMISMLLAITLVLGMAACAKEETDTTKATKPTAPAAEEVTAPTAGPDATPETQPVAPIVTEPAVDVKWEVGEGAAAVFYGKGSDEVKAALDAALTAEKIDFTDIESEDLDAMQKAVDDGAAVLLVSLSDADKAQDVVNLAKNANVPLVFFNCSIPQGVVTAYDRCALLETDEAQIGRTQGRMAGDFLGYNFEVVDRNGDGVISYALLKDDGSNAEAASCSTYAVGAANEMLTQYGRPDMFFYDAANLDDAVAVPEGGWTKEAGKQTAKTILTTYNEGTDSLVEVFFVNNEAAALGVVEALQEAGYNTMGNWYVPVFGVGNSDEMLEHLQSGEITGVVRYDANSMAKAVCTMAKNLFNGASIFAGIDAEVDGTWRANVAYGIETGE